MSRRLHLVAWPIGLLALGGICPVAQAAKESPADVPISVHACTKILSGLERLACFDAAAGTPVESVRPAVIAVAAAAPEIVSLVQANEATRKPENSGFLIAQTVERKDAKQPRVVISAPALGALRPRPYLVVSCLSNISRLQLVLGRPIDRNLVHVRLLLDDHPISADAPWQVLNQGVIVDAGRGLPGIDTIRRLGGGVRLRVVSDEPRLNDLLFDASDLGALIDQQRQACHW